jgi:hypothetical protein
VVHDENVVSRTTDVEFDAIGPEGPGALECTERVFSLSSRRATMGQNLHRHPKSTYL